MYDPTTDPTTDTDEALTEGLRNGNSSAFKQIYSRYWGVLYMHAYKMLQEQDTAMDIIQDVFTDIWLKGETLVIHTSLKSYLYTAVRYKTLDALRRSTRHEHYVTSMLNFAAEGQYTTDDDVNLRDFIRRMESEVALLPPRMRAIFERSRLQGQSNKVIAQELSITDHTVKKTLNRALKVLRSKLTVLFFL